MRGWGEGEKKEGMPECDVKKLMRNGILLIGILLLLVLMGTASAKALPVDVASDSDTIIVHSDTSGENVDLNKQLPLQSENGAVSTIIQSVLIIMLMMLLLRFMKTLYLQVLSQ